MRLQASVSRETKEMDIAGAIAQDAFRTGGV